MKKKYLKDIDTVSASRNTVSLAKRVNAAKWFIKAERKSISGDKILVVFIYDRERLVMGNVLPKYVLYMTRKDYITFSCDNKKWLTGRLEYILGIYFYNYKEKNNRIVCCDIKTEKVLKGYFSYIKKILGNRFISADTTVDMLICGQEIIMEERLKRKHKKITDKIDLRMKSVKALPKNFMLWCDETAMFDSRYIYYTYSRKKYMDGYCTHCHSDVKVTGAKHRKEGICPNCGSKIKYLVNGKVSMFCNYGEAAYFQKTDNGFVVRYFSIVKKFFKDYRKNDILITELKRDFYENGDTFIYEWRAFKQTGNIRWCEGYSKWDFLKTAVYTKNIDKVLGNTEYKYSAIKIFADRKPGAKVCVGGYLYKYKNTPYIEFIVKAGLYNIADDITRYIMYGNEFNKNSKKIWDYIGVTKEQFKTVQVLDMDCSELKIYKKFIEFGIVLDCKKFLEVYNKFIVKNINIFAVIKYTTLHKIEKYTDKNNPADIKNFFDLWGDYLRFCNELGYDMKNDFVLFPKDLKKSHDECYRDLERKKQEERKRKIKTENKRAKKLLKKYAEIYIWNDKNFSVVVPKDLFSIKEEGYSLHHCVGSYTTKVANGETVILFIRRNTDLNKPFYTMEVKNGKILQCYGYKNDKMTEEVQAFTEKYSKKVLQKLNMKQAV